MPVVESRYAEALLSAAPSPETANKAGEVLADFSALLVSHDDLYNFLLSPVISREIKKDTVRKILSEDDTPLLTNFISLLIDKGRIEFLPDISEEYKKLKDMRQSNLEIYVYSAKPLEDLQLSEIREKYRKQYGALTAEIHYQTDTSLLGGVRIQIGDICIDDTLSGRLNGLLSAFEI